MWYDIFSHRSQCVVRGIFLKDIFRLLKTVKKAIEPDSDKYLFSNVTFLYLYGIYKYSRLSKPKFCKAVLYQHL